MNLFHGSLNHNEFENNVFFSTSVEFAKDYGEVKQYKVNMQNTFDTLNDYHVKRLFDYKGFLYEPYDEITLNSYEEYLNTDFYGCDNWELFEQYITTIRQMGYDSMRIFEGGIENFVVFNKCFQLVEI